MARAAPMRNSWPLCFSRPIPTTTTTAAAATTTIPGLLSSLFTKTPHFSFASSHYPPHHHLFFSSSPFPRNPLSQTHGLRLPGTSVTEEDEDSDGPSTKSRNERKKEARRAFRWGMELAAFSPSQIKRVLRAASLEREVFDALMLVKRLGPDVREGRRRQFNYIGRLLRKVEPELMDALIQASKDGDNSRLQILSGMGTWTTEDEEEEEGTKHEEEGCTDYIEVVARWFDGLIYKDSSITNEVYSIHSIEFDRQELRKLVRRVQEIQDAKLAEESGGENDAALTRAKKSLDWFLRSLAKQTLAE